MYLNMNLVGRVSTARILAAGLGATMILSLAGCSSGPSSVATSTTNATSSATASLKQGIAALKADNYSQAEDSLRQAVNEDPSNANGLKGLAYYNLGVALQSAGATDQAINAYKSAVELEPTFTSALFNLAEAQSAADPSAALVTYNKILQIKANDTNSLFNSGLIMYSQGDSAGGSARIKQAIAQDSSLSSRVPSNVNLG